MMKGVTLALILSIVLNVYQTECISYLPKIANTVTVNLPGFASFIPNPNNDKYHVAISSFNGVPWSSDYVYFIGNYSLTEPNVLKRLDNTDLHWPNEITYTSDSFFNASVDPFGGLLVSGGFLVPTKGDGALLYYPFNKQDRSNITANIKPIKISSAKTANNWFYHRVKQVDMNGDGQKDLLTCRSYKPLIGSTKVELVAFLYDSLKQTFTEKIISNDACDVFFDVADLDNDGRFEIVATGFFLSKLVIYYSEDENNSFVSGKVKSNVIDANGGQFFDIEIVDLDHDGSENKYELLVTNHQGNNDQVKGSLFYYKLTGNVRTGKWVRNLIHNDFKVLKFGIKQASPGGAKAFHPNLKDTKSRPYILVSGDGSEYAYLFEPNQSGPLSYNLTWKYHYKGYTVGGTSIADVDGDGYVEAAICAYEANKFDVWTFAP